MSTSNSDLAHSMAMGILACLFGGLTLLLLVASLISYAHDSPMTKWLMGAAIMNLCSTAVFIYRFMKS